MRQIMKLYFVLLAIPLAVLSGSSISKQDSCVPAYAVLDDALDIPVGTWELRFRLLVVGCDQGLRENWPPKLDQLKRELAIELQEPHPVQTLLLIRERSPQLRQRLVKRINKLLASHVVEDVFLFDAKAAEGI